MVAQTLRRERPALAPAPLALAAAASLAVGAALTAHASVLAAAGALAVVIAAVRRWPLLVWAAALVASLFFYRAVWTTPVVGAGGMTLYVSDCLPLVLAAAALSAGRERLGAIRGARFTLGAAAAFVVVVLAAAYRTLHTTGLAGVLQARHLLPFALVLVLPFARGFRAVRAERLATAFALLAGALAMRSLVLLGSGYQAREIPGVQRIFQTWEPFIAAALGLTLLAYVLSAPRPGLVHYAGLAASTMPVLFSFFRVAWILLAVLGALLLFLVRGRGRGPRIVAAVLVCAALAGTAGRLVSPSAARYQHELATRAGEIGIGLDNYRTREYSAVWTEIKQRPVAGSGFGTEYRADWTIYRSWAHNAYEWLWWRLGLFGLVSFLALVVGAIATGLAAARRLDGAERGLALGLVAGVGFTALAANLHENFENYQTNLFVALALAQLIALRCRAEARS